MPRTYIKTEQMRDEIAKVFEATTPPLTVRQVFYQLVSRSFFRSTEENYDRVIRALKILRKNGTIPYENVEDRTRGAIQRSTWLDLPSFFESVKLSYVRDLWQNQDNYVEIWLEKSALANIFSEITESLQVRLMPERGYASISFLRAAATELKAIAERKSIFLYYFGDHDPSGRNIEDTTKGELEDFGVDISHWNRVAILGEDITKFNLPPAPAKEGDTRHDGFVAEHGGDTVELDALPPNELRRRIQQCILKHIDGVKWEEQEALQRKENRRLSDIIGRLRIR